MLRRIDPSSAIRRLRGSGLVLTACLAIVHATPADTHARQVVSTYVDDSVLAREALSRVRDLVAGGNASEAARVLQQVLDADADRVVESQTDPDRFLGVRHAVHLALLGNAQLLERYRQSEEPVAKTLLADARLEELERTRLLTRSGLEAALRLAQEHLESARFEAARLALEQLDAHPDRRSDPDAARDCAAAATMLARYLPRESVRSLAARWREESGLPAAQEDSIPWPQAWNDSIGRSSLDPAAMPPLDSLIGGPSQSAFMSADAAVEYTVSLEAPPDEALSRYLIPWTIPTIVGDFVVVNDGRAITAFDRFTLSALWRRDFSEYAPADTADQLDPIGGRVPDVGRIVVNFNLPEDANSNAAAQGVIVAATGIAAGQSREGDARIHAIELPTGRALWSLAPGDIADTLKLSEVRGPAVIEESTAIIGFRKSSIARRLSSVHLAGVDLWSGRTRWVRLIGSAGSLGSSASRPGETPVIHHGVIYRADDSGLISAIEAASGRVRWIRRLKSELLMRSSEPVPPWASARPIIDENSLIVLSPTRTEIHRLSLDDGSTIGVRDLAGLPVPLHYLLAIGTAPNRRLAAVTEDQIALLPMRDFEKSNASLVPTVPEPGYRGRVMVMGDLLAAPVDSGVMLIDPENPREPRLRPLDSTGSMAASGSNLIVVDQWRVHSYLLWEDARALLVRRIDADKDDPRPAVALAELAFRSGKFDQIVPACDLALGAIARNPDSERSLQTRVRLFQSLAMMTRPRGDHADSSPTAPQGNDTRAGNDLRIRRVIDDLAIVDQLVERLGLAAESPVERVTWLDTLAGVRELQADAQAACEAYQRILEDSLLAGTLRREQSPPIRSSAWAARRLREIVARFGRAAYARFDAELDAELASLAPDAAVDRLESLAARYPVARAAPGLLLRIAAAHQAASASNASLASLASASELAAWLTSIADPVEPALDGEITGRHAAALEQLGKPMTAAMVLHHAAFARPTLATTPRTPPALPNAPTTPPDETEAGARKDQPVTRSSVRATVQGSPLDLPAKILELRTLASEQPREARTGFTPAPRVEVLTGWSLMLPTIEPFDDSPRGSHEHALLLNMYERCFALMADVGSGSLSPIWSRTFPNRPPTVLSHAQDSILLLWPSELAIERVDVISGQTLWRTATLDEIIPSSVGDQVTFDTPLDGQVRLFDLVIAANRRTMVVARRSGEAAAIDLAAGAVRWTARGGISRLYDIAITEDAVAFSGALDRVAGDARLDGPVEPGMRIGPTPVILARELADGTERYRLDTLDSDVRWIRAGETTLVAALVDRVRAFDLRTGMPTVWAGDVAGDAALHTADAWIFDDTLYMLTRRREIWPVSLTTGIPAESQLRDSDRIADSGLIRARRVGDNVMFSSRAGIAMFDSDANLAGANAAGGRRPFLPAVVGDDAIALIEHAADMLDDGRSVLRVTLLSASSAKLMNAVSLAVHTDPDDIHATFLDDALIVTTDNVTQVIRLPSRRD